MSFWVYMLRCADDSFYIGQTDDLEQRIGQHQTGALPGYAHNRRPVTLVFSQELQTRDEAIATERQIKGWSRAKKEALIRGDWMRIQQLAWGRNHPLPERLSHLPVHPSIPQGERNAETVDHSYLGCNSLSLGKRRAGNSPQSTCACKPAPRGERAPMEIGQTNLKRKESS